MAAFFGANNSVAARDLAVHFFHPPFGNGAGGEGAGEGIGCPHKPSQNGLQA